MSLHSLLSIDFKKYIPVFILNFLSKLKYIFKIISPIVLFITVVFFWGILFAAVLDGDFSSSEQPVNTEQPATTTAQPIYQTVGNARDMDGENMQIFVADTKSILRKVFLFQYDDGSIATAFSAENPAITGPDFRIMEGQKREWLVVTTIKNWGTGHLNHVDTWYDVSYWGRISVVLSYLSDSNTYDGGGTLIRKLTTDASISADDKTIEIKYIFDDCETQNKCTKTTKAAYYVWDSEKGFFVLDEKKSEISALELSHLM